MKKISYMLAAFAAVATLTTSCSSDDELVQNGTQEGKTITLTLDATRGESATSRSTISKDNTYGVLNSSWAAGDKIHVYSTRTGDDLGTLTLTGDVINQKTSATATTTTSYATFSGSVTLGATDQLTDEYTFVYQGAGQSLTADADGNLSYTLATQTSESDLNAFDIAYATGKIQGTADGKNVASASASVSFSNKMAFGYFTTEGATTTALNFDYASGFTFNVKTGTVTAVAGTVSLPANCKFYLPLIPGQEVSLSNKTWSSTDYTYSEYANEIKFKPSAGGYYRLGKSSSYGPCKIVAKSSIKWDTMSGKVFSVASGKTVSFTQGNLQYMYVDGTNDYWQFAPTQYSYLGASNGKIATGETTFKGNIDLFGWGAIPAADGTMLGAADNTLYPCGTGTTQTWSGTSGEWDPAASYDWGQYIKANSKTIWVDKTKNKSITQPDAGYRVLTSDEWKYLLDTRTFSDDATAKTYAFATVTLTGGTQVKGIVVFPDGVTLAQANTLGFTKFGNQSSDNYNANLVNQSVIDDNGLLFLPAAGYRNGAGVNNVGSGGYYWSSTAFNATYARYVLFNSSGFDSQGNYGNRCYGFSVRLVQDNQ